MEVSLESILFSSIYGAAAFQGLLLAIVLWWCKAKQTLPNWNSTVISIEGDIQEGEKIKLQSTLDPKRNFKLKVKPFQPNTELVWGDGMGKGTYSLKKLDN